MGNLHTITQNSTVSSRFGYGIGRGVSLDFSSFENFEISTEIAQTTIATPFYTGYNWPAIHFGLHYYFGNQKYEKISNMTSSIF